MTTLSPALNRERRFLKESNVRIDCFRSTGMPPAGKVMPDERIFEELTLAIK
jgi:hypothetical protein